MGEGLTTPAATATPAAAASCRRTSRGEASTPAAGTGADGRQTVAFWRQASVSAWQAPDPSGLPVAPTDAAPCGLPTFTSPARTGACAVLAH